MKGIIMAGGEGSRLRPMTCDLPKPMVPVMNKPVMAYSINLLNKYGIRDIGVTLQYRPEQIMDFFQDGSEYGVRLNYYIEETPLGTAGSVKNTGDFIDQSFVVISGDSLTDIDLEEAIKFHKRNKSTATLVLKRVEVPLDYGVVVTSQSGEITRFLEKPNWERYLVIRSIQASTYLNPRCWITSKQEKNLTSVRIYSLYFLKITSLCLDI